MEDSVRVKVKWGKMKRKDGVEIPPLDLKPGLKIPLHLPSVSAEVFATVVEVDEDGENVTLEVPGYVAEILGFERGQCFGSP